MNGDRLEDILFSMVEGKGMTLTASTIENRTPEGRTIRDYWYDKLSPYFRLNHGAQAPNDGAYTYVRLDTGEAAVLRRLSAGSVTGRSFAHAIVGGWEALDRLALPLTLWRGWYNPEDRDPLERRSFEQLSAKVTAKIVTLRVAASTVPPEQVTGLLAHVLAAPHARFTVVGLAEPHVAPVLAAVRTISEALGGRPRSWTFSTYETDAKQRHALDFVFMPHNPGVVEASGVPTVLLDLADGPVPPKWRARAELLYRDYLRAWDVAHAIEEEERTRLWAAVSDDIHQRAQAGGPEPEDRAEAYARSHHADPPQADPPQADPPQADPPQADSSDTDRTVGRHAKRPDPEPDEDDVTDPAGDADRAEHPDSADPAGGTDSAEHPTTDTTDPADGADAAHHPDPGFPDPADTAEAGPDSDETPGHTSVTGPDHSGTDVTDEHPDPAAQAGPTDLPPTGREAGWFVKPSVEPVDGSTPEESAEPDTGSEASAPPQPDTRAGATPGAPAPLDLFWAKRPDDLAEALNRARRRALPTAVRPALWHWLTEQLPAATTVAALQQDDVFDSLLDLLGLPEPHPAGVDTEAVADWVHRHLGPAFSERLRDRTAPHRQPDPATATPEHIDWRFPPVPASDAGSVQEVWRMHLTWRRAADRLEQRVDTARRLTPFLLLPAAAAGAVSGYAARSAVPLDGKAFGVAAALLLIGWVLLHRYAVPTAIRRLSATRAVAESLRSMVFLYVAGVGRFRDRKPHLLLHAATREASRVSGRRKPVGVPMPAPPSITTLTDYLHLRVKREISAHEVQAGQWRVEGDWLRRPAEICAMTAAFGFLALVFLATGPTAPWFGVATTAILTFVLLAAPNGSDERIARSERIADRLRHLLVVPVHLPSTVDDFVVACEQVIAGDERRAS
ncbi:hypothetical protein FHX81_6915 [Saccharothrix saharensis]|uniref:SMODS and SLOG-associating 2TM effector domain-containing protein n=1 Tax=Saccharothrix saharensis TaxID=571190 RepID=A0A543JNQ1_9PSEU|nr:DUF4231 domain-containing protein [Saccharothrix saharensis]TQM84469.1 hypothetical protein FHX81_6915 [Saccharothrix saharensis]